MGISTDYREFRSREGYDQFFQEVRAEGPNHVDMIVPPIGKSSGGIVNNTYVVHPDIDFKLLDYVISQPQYNGRWVIRPVLNLQKYRDNTDKRSYRVALRKPQVIEYRRLMTIDNVFMPFLVFDAKRKLWLSGRHRAEASKNAYGALYALVLEDLTDEESLYITDITNQWHQESWTEDERSLIALEYMLQEQMTWKQALLHVHLPVDDEAPILGAMLYRRWEQSPQDRRLLESGINGKGRPFELKSWGTKVKVFGRDSIPGFPLERWLYLKDAETRQALGLLRSRTGSMVRDGVASEFKQREKWALNGTSEDRWMQFLEIVQEVRDVNMSRESGVHAPTDDRIWMNFVYKYTATNDSGLIAIKRELSKAERAQSATVVDRLSRIYGS